MANDISHISIDSFLFNFKDSNAVHTSGTETVGGSKTFTSNLNVQIASQYKYIYFKHNGDSNGTSSFIRVNAGDSTNQSVNQIVFCEYSPKSTAGTANTGYYEAYYLPAPTAGLTSNPSAYAIYTSKNLKSLTASSGGTSVSLVTTGEKYTWNNKLSNSASHASTATTYGIGNGSNYGHVKLSDTISSINTSQKAANGVAASAWALQSAYDFAKEHCAPSSNETIQGFCDKIIEAGTGFFTVNSTIGQTLIGGSTAGNAFGMAKNVSGRIDYVAFAPAISKVSVGTIDTDNNYTVTVKKSF